MTNYIDRSTLEILPDEILLEVCKYLLCADVLQAFFGLNSRIKRTITQYCHHVSLHKVSITQSSYLYTNILPHIGSRIRSLVIDRSYSLMQNDLFIKYFINKMSITFPNLEKISLITFRHNHLLDFLNTLQNLNSLVEIHLHHLFGSSSDCPVTILPTLLQSNNNKLTSIFIDDQSSSLSFNEMDSYENILQLRLKMGEIRELPLLFAAVPNVQYLDVIFEQDNSQIAVLDQMHIFSLHYLTNFRLKATKHWWHLGELSTILRHLTNVQSLSLFLCTKDTRLANGNMLLPLLPTTVQQFNYAIYYFPMLELIEETEIVSSWPPSHPITCLPGDTFSFIHTVPWQFERLTVLSSFGKTMSSKINHEASYDKQVEYLNIISNKKFTLAHSLRIIAQCHRMKTLSIWVHTDGDIVEEQQRSLPSLPRLSRLIRIHFYPSSTVDIDHLLSIFIVAPNLYQLDLPSDCLIHLLENQQVCRTLGQQIMSLNIYKATTSSQLNLTEEHILLIASIFTSVRDLYVDLKHLSSSEAIISNETTSLSVESMLLCLLSKFKEHKLISLCVDIAPFEKIEADAYQWLQDNTFLGEKQFDASFNANLKRLIIWM